MFPGNSAVRQMVKTFHFTFQFIRMNVFECIIIEYLTYNVSTCEILNVRLKVSFKVK